MSIVYSSHRELTGFYKLKSIKYPSIRTSQAFVKKKAALTLLRLYRKHPEVIPAEEWALRIVSIMDDDDLVRVLLIRVS